jgi:hypothetical protein
VFLGPILVDRVDGTAYAVKKALLEDSIKARPGAV